ncbi:MAG: NADPH-dependent FMN reductase [Pseudomonadota bacterium]
MNILAFAASNSSKSINHQLVRYATSMLNADDVEIININDYEMPLFSEDREAELGHPRQAQDFRNKIGESDAIVISFAEHNGSYTAAWKNLFDWTSRIDQNVFQGKPVIFLATSPGPGGASNVLSQAATSAPYFGGELIASLSVPSFYEHFDTDTGRLRNRELNDKLTAVMQSLREKTAAKADLHTSGEMRL